MSVNASIVKIGVEVTEAVVEVAAEYSVLELHAEQRELKLVVAAGPRGADGGEAVYYDALNRDAVTLVAGLAVAVHGTGIGVLRATAVGADFPAVGLVRTAAEAGHVARVQTLGVFELQDWTAATGAVTLSALAPYFLDAVAGKLTTSPQAVGGRINQLVGKAVTPTTLRILPQYPILM
jgi:hypothetical protein